MLKVTFGQPGQSRFIHALQGGDPLSVFTFIRAFPQLLPGTDDFEPGVEVYCALKKDDSVRFMDQLVARFGEYGVPGLPKYRVTECGNP